MQRSKVSLKIKTLTFEPYFGFQSPWFEDVSSFPCTFWGNPAFKLVLFLKSVKSKVNEM